METHLKINHLAPYLPYNTRVISVRGTVFLLDTYSNMKGSGIESRDIQSVLGEQMKPILRPLSDLTKEEFSYLHTLLRVHLGKNKRDKLINEGYGITDLPYFIFEQLLENHFDLFKLIENNLAIDINTL